MTNKPKLPKTLTKRKKSSTVSWTLAADTSEGPEAKNSNCAVCSEVTPQVDEPYRDPAAIKIMQLANKFKEPK